MSRPIRSVLIPCLVLTGAACASGPSLPPSIAPDAQPTLDGLYPVDNSVLQLAEAKRDLDLSGYTAFMLSPVQVAYKKEPRPRSSGSLDSNFALSPQQMETLTSTFQE